MSEISELQVHERAQQSFERDHPGRVWRELPPQGKRARKPEDFASLFERQAYLLKARHQLLSEQGSASQSHGPSQNASIYSMDERSSNI